MLSIHRSNRLESLADRLGDLVSAAPLADPFQPEIVIVQSLGMRRWLTLTLAGRLGVSMNCEFPFPHTLAHDVFRSAFPDLSGTSAFSREILPWRIFARLPGLISQPAFLPLQRYIGSGELSELKQFQLARQLGTLFDRHLAYRPDAILAWERDDTAVAASDWQTRLWRELAHGQEQLHPPALLERFEHRLETGDATLPGLPSRISLFGISSLPPYYLHLLNAVAQCVDLHLFLFEPTDQYWGDITSPREQRRFLRRHAKPEQTAADFHLDTGNALLASLGKPSRDFARAIQDLEPNDAEELFSPPTGDSLLSRVQADIFELRERPAGEPEPLPAAVDRSLQIHCCHGPMRELDVLHDQLLDLFAHVPGLTPKDILVMMPDVEPFAPFIEAVFDAPDDEAHRIPFTIADRSARTESATAQTFLQLLSLRSSRFTAPEVLALLEAAPVRRRFGLSETDLDHIRAWIEETGIRWGLDGAHRATFGVPSFEPNSWRTGLDRLLLGYALPGDGTQLWDGILPYNGIEGSLTVVLGQFADFAAKLADLLPRLATPRTLDAWERALSQILHTFLDDSEASADEIRRLRTALEMLGRLVEVHPDPVSFEVVQAHLTQAFADTDSGHGFLVGHVTFCSLKPMRSIPFRVICMLGLNDTAFPRRDPAGSLDLLAQGGPAGRSRRDEDRQVFLESLLSARDVFYLSYTGLSAADNSASPPSVVISELLDYLDENFVSGTEPLRTSVVTQHRLQPFSSAYFSGHERLFSYSAENCRASREIAARQRLSPPLIDAPLPESAADPGAIELSDLLRFFRHPAKFFLTRSLALRLPDEKSLLGESEPMKLDSLDRWHLQQELATALFQGGDRHRHLRATRAANLLPAGLPGDSALQGVAGEVDDLVARALAEAREQPLPPLPVALEIEGRKLTGQLGDLYPSGIIRLTGWKLSPKDRLLGWVEHLVLNLLRTEPGSTETRLFATDCTLRFAPVANPTEVLATLLSIYQEGQRTPRPFFPETSFEFARRTLRPGSREKSPPEAGARKIWETKECTDSHNDLCFRDRDPLDEIWRELALRIYQPMLAHSTERKA